MCRDPGRTVSLESTSRFLAVLRLTGNWSAAALAANETVARMRRLENRDEEFRVRVFASEVCFAARLATRPQQFPSWSNQTVVRRRRDRILAIAKALRAAAD
ncbi:MAG: hypothetical protein L0227_17230, partial [Chloroflexi bacterium]|nr:hypothetical protein [Chloroflexota bacterium]